MINTDLARALAEALLEEAKETLACAAFIDRYIVDANGPNAIGLAERTRAQAETFFGVDVVGRTLTLSDRLTDAQRAAFS